jgi:outer membrane protein insertion porin family
MRRALLAAVIAAGAAGRVAGQEPGFEPIVFDSIAVEGLSRVPRSTVLAAAGVPLGSPVGFRDVQRAMSALFALKQFDDVRFAQGRVNDRTVLRIFVTERPLLVSWSVRGVEEVSERRVRGKVTLLAGRPYDRAEAARSRAAIDSVYLDEGFYLTEVTAREVPQEDGTIHVTFDIVEGRRVKISQVIVQGNEQFTDHEVVGRMSTKPEGFWWWRSGEFDEDKLELDLRDRLPRFYASKGYVDFQVVSDTLMVAEGTGKGALALTVREGEQYEIGDFEIVGNQFFSTASIERFYPFGGGSSGFLGIGGSSGDGPEIFDQEEWEEATQQVRNLYNNNGYIYAQIAGTIDRRTTTDGRNVVDLRWRIREGQPAVINRILVRGNTVTHEDVIRRAIVMIPGDVMRQDALIRSYQNIANLGFFEQPMPPPDVQPANDQGDVDVIFNVKERHTGNINFGASSASMSRISSDGRSASHSSGSSAATSTTSTCRTPIRRCVARSPRRRSRSTAPGYGTRWPILVGSPPGAAAFRSVSRCAARATRVCSHRTRSSKAPTIPRH